MRMIMVTKHLMIVHLALPPLLPLFLVPSWFSNKLRVKFGCRNKHLFHHSSDFCLVWDAEYVTESSRTSGLSAVRWR